MSRIILWPYQVSKFFHLWFRVHVVHAGNYDTSLFENYPVPKGLQKRIVKFPEDFELHPRKFYLHSAPDLPNAWNFPFPSRISW